MLPVLSTNTDAGLLNLEKSEPEELLIPATVTPDDKFVLPEANFCMR